MLAVACLVVAYVNRDNPGKGQIEGAYFEPKTPGEGWTAYAPIEEEPVGFSRFEPFDAWDPYLWLGPAPPLRWWPRSWPCAPSGTSARPDEAQRRTRTGDPFLTMEVLYQLS
jgi:hypothetical protein